MPDIVAVAETIAKAGRTAAQHFANTFEALGAAFAESRKAFDDSEAGDYLSAAGADALVDTFGRMESDGPDAAETHAPFTFGDLSEAARIIDTHASRLPQGFERFRLIALANRLADASEADPNP